ncbi:MAG: agmatine deiminase family protein, partial [Chitinophagaceae bacterium]|nr:agmatine deiminase family protein [Chitinophagaceae bacterium]
LLPKTNDVWAVDYMPIQIEQHKYVQFIYKPSYLKSKKDLKSISNVTAICEQIGIETIKSNIRLDGGNVIRTTDKVIMTERVFTENPTIERKDLIDELQNIFQVEKLFIIPEYPDEMTGHADGMIRFLDVQTVLINSFTKEEKEFSEVFEKAVQKTGLDYIKIPYNPNNNENNIQANGLYINFLQMDGVIFLPIFGIPEDDLAVKQFEQLFEGQDVVPVKGNEIAHEGGILNCISWNILK